MTEDVEYDVDEPPDSDFDKSAVRVFDKIYNIRSGVLPSSKFLTWLKHLGSIFIGRS